MSKEEDLKSVRFVSFHKEDLERLYKISGKHVDNLELLLKDCRYLRDILLTFVNTKELEISIINYDRDIKREVIFPLLRKVHFHELIPSELKNFWKLFSNLEHVIIGKRGSSNVFTSEFVNKVIQRNSNSLKTLKLLDLGFVKSTFSALRVPCQLKNLEIIFFKDTSKERVCRSEYNKQKVSKTSQVFYVNEDEITSFTSFSDILKSQNELEYLFLEGAVINSESLDILSKVTSMKKLKLIKPEFNFGRISESAKLFFSQIENLFISHVSESSCIGFCHILNSLKRVEILEINCIWQEVNLTLEFRNLLPKLRILKMHVNYKSELILNSLQLTENLEHLTADIQDINTIKEVLRTSPKIKEIILHNGENKIANFTVRKFKNLQRFELISKELSLETVLHIVSKSANVKKAKIYSLSKFSRDVEDQLNERLEKRFPGFFCFNDDFDFFSFATHLVVTNEDDDEFTLNIRYHSYRLDEQFV